MYKIYKMQKIICNPMGIISGLLTRGCKDHFEC